MITSFFKGSFNATYSIARNYSKMLAFSLVFICFFSKSSYASLEENQCLSAISKYEEKFNIPKGLLKAVSKVESRFNPYALNDGVRGHDFKSKEEIVEKAKHLINTNKKSFDVGCMQLNYLWHGKYFDSVEEMVDVNSNVRYAASHLYGLYKSHGSWNKAVRFYHSYDPNYYKIYSRKVAIAWLSDNTTNIKLKGNKNGKI